VSTPAHTILIVDDDGDFVAAARAVLEGHGYRVVAAESTAAGFDAAKRERPSLILLDLMMEEADSGVRLAHQLRGDPLTEDVPIAILTSVRKVTGFGFTPTKAEDYEWISADAWVEKPVPPRQLAELAARLLPKAPEAD
jgi:CheY-like chemotaxis protein